MTNVTNTTETPTSPPVEYLDWNQTEDYSRLSRTFLRRQIAAGHLTVIRVGGRVLFAKDDLNQYLLKHRTTGRAASGRGVAPPSKQSRKEATNDIDIT